MNWQTFVLKRVYDSNRKVNSVRTRIEKLKKKLTPEDMKDIVIMMMLQKNGRFGWDFVERISKSNYFDN